MKTSITSIIAVLRNSQMSALLNDTALDYCAAGLSVEHASLARFQSESAVVYLQPRMISLQGTRTGARVAKRL